MQPLMTAQYYLAMKFGPFPLWVHHGHVHVWHTQPLLLTVIYNRSMWPLSGILQLVHIMQGGQVTTQTNSLDTLSTFGKVFCLMTCNILHCVHLFKVTCLDYITFVNNLEPILVTNISLTNGYLSTNAVIVVIIQCNLHLLWLIYKNTAF